MIHDYLHKGRFFRIYIYQAASAAPQVAEWAMQNYTNKCTQGVIRASPVCCPAGGLNIIIIISHC